MRRSFVKGVKKSLKGIRSTGDWIYVHKWVLILIGVWIMGEKAIKLSVDEDIMA
jgi:hypothetical protein